MGLFKEKSRLLKLLINVNDVNIYSRVEWISKKSIGPTDVNQLIYS